MEIFKKTKAQVKIMSALILMAVLLSASNVSAQEVQESARESGIIAAPRYVANSKDYADIYMYAGSAKVDVWVMVSDNYGTAGMDSTQVCDMNVDGICYDQTGDWHNLYGGAGQVYSYSTWARSVTMRQMRSFDVVFSASSDNGSENGRLEFDFEYGSHTFN